MMMTLVFGLIVLDIYNILNCVYQTIVDIYDKYIPYCVVVYIYAFLPLINTCSTLQRVERRVCRALYNPGVKNVKREK